MSKKGLQQFSPLFQFSLASIPGNLYTLVRRSLGMPRRVYSVCKLHGSKVLEQFDVFSCVQGLYKMYCDNFLPPIRRSVTCGHTTNTNSPPKISL